MRVFSLRISDAFPSWPKLKQHLPFGIAVPFVGRVVVSFFRLEAARNFSQHPGKSTAATFKHAQARQ